MVKKVFGILLVPLILCGCSSNSQKTEAFGESQVTTAINDEGGESKITETLFTIEEEDLQLTPTIMLMEGLEVIQLTFEGEANGCPVWSPDGKRIAFEHTIYSEKYAATSELYVMDADGSSKIQLTDFQVRVI